MAGNSEVLLRALLATTGRAAFSADDLRVIVDPQGKSDKQVKAYNLANGTLTQGEIAKKLKLDAGNFSRTVNRWVEAGVMFKLSDNVLLHVFPIPK